MKKIAIAFSLLLGLTAHTNAAPQGDAQAGKAKSATCAACHGADGNSMIPANPNLAGQSAAYLLKQLKEFKSAATGGEGRKSAVMGAMAMPLSEQDMADLAAYFSSQEPKPGATPEDVIKAGQKLYNGGDTERGVTACIACHGPRGNGMGLAGFPKISFQHADYVAAQLKAFRDGSRDNDLNGMMRDVAAKLSDKDIETLSKYVGGLH
ncbi:cytochrome c4 [Saccharobesus litoralis]|uniref:Cytochrome c4 n=1 Tax=Saccharobesus litoralis TaxID=2172099 RepID=A0A2S0VQZ0_9ALTE|nr:c-type cytochrome [Saccharobesus litoralis]AWB66633.1 cytochrome c4 [Saccharobesus litoralis]